jgi:hypothetical protein
LSSPRKRVEIDGDGVSFFDTLSNLKMAFEWLYVPKMTLSVGHDTTAEQTFARMQLFYGPDF